MMEYIWLERPTLMNTSAIEELKEVCLARDGRLPLLNLPEQPKECDRCLVAVEEYGVCEADESVCDACAKAMYRETGDLVAHIFFACDNCLKNQSKNGRIVGLLTGLESGNTVEVSILVHPDFRRKGIGTELLHRLILSTDKVPFFPVAAGDTEASEFLTYIGKQELYREMLLTLTKKNYVDAVPEMAQGRRKWLHVTCEERPLIVAAPSSNLTEGTAAASTPDAEKGSAEAPAPDTKEESGAASAPDRQEQYTLYFGDVPIGRCLMTEGCVSDVWIRSTFRGRGYGSFLLRTVIRHQFSSGRRKLFLHVTSLNEAACALYRRYGFEVTEEILCYV